MALKHVMINEIISEHSARMQNLKKYYPFFVLCDSTFSQYREGRYSNLDMGYITMASLRFFINENNFHEKDVTYEEYEAFLIELLRRDFALYEEAADERQLALYIFDKLKNDGKAFEFRFFDPETKLHKLARVRFIDSRIENGKVLYYITAEGIEFYLDTKEIKDESQISVSQLLLEKMISSNNFRGGIDVVARINSQVNRLYLEKERVLKQLALDVFEGAKAYEEYMNTTAKWFSEEQKLFAKNKALVDKAIERAVEHTPKEILELETQLKQTIYNHSRLIEETVELTQLSDKIISRAKLKRLRPVFDFGKSLATIMERDEPSRMAHILMPFFMPRLQKTFSIRSIDNILTLKSDDKNGTEKVEKKVVDADFRYEDEILDEKIGRNFAKLFYEILDQVDKWKQVSLQELNGIYEIKFGKEIYGNRDYYSFLVHLAGKKFYSMKQMLEKQDTLLEEMVITFMSEDDKERFKDMELEIIPNSENMIRLDIEGALKVRTAEKLADGILDEEEAARTENIDAEMFSVTDFVITSRKGGKDSGR